MPFRHTQLRPDPLETHLHVGDFSAYSQSYDQIRCAVMQGGQGDVKHWAFNDPPKRTGNYRDAPPSPAEYRKLPTRVTDLHPMTVIQNARTLGGGQVSLVPTRAATVGPVRPGRRKKSPFGRPAPTTIPSACG